MDFFLLINHLALQVEIILFAEAPTSIYFLMNVEKRMPLRVKRSKRHEVPEISGELFQRASRFRIAARLEIELILCIKIQSEFNKKMLLRKIDSLRISRGLTMHSNLTHEANIHIASRVILNASKNRFERMPMALDRSKFLNNNEKRVLFCLMQFMKKEDGWHGCFPSLITIAGRANLCKKSAHNVLKRLEKLGMITWKTGRLNNSKEPKSNQYFLCADVDARLSWSYSLRKEILKGSTPLAVEKPVRVSKKKYVTFDQMQEFMAMVQKTMTSVNPYEKILHGEIDEPKKNLPESNGGKSYHHTVASFTTYSDPKYYLDPKNGSNLLTQIAQDGFLKEGREEQDSQNKNREQRQTEERKDREPSPIALPPPLEKIVTRKSAAPKLTRRQRKKMLSKKLSERSEGVSGGDNMFPKPPKRLNAKERALAKLGRKNLKSEAPEANAFDSERYVEGFGIPKPTREKKKEKKFKKPKREALADELMEFYQARRKDAGLPESREQIYGREHTTVWKLERQFGKQVLKDVIEWAVKNWKVAQEVLSTNDRARGSDEPLFDLCLANFRIERWNETLRNGGKPVVRSDYMKERAEEKKRNQSFFEENAPDVVRLDDDGR